MLLKWDFVTPGGPMTITFEHSGTTGKRLIMLNGKEVIHHRYMFNLVGAEEFRFGPGNCHLARIDIEPAAGLSFAYKLEIDGKPVSAFTEQMKRALRSWRFNSKDGAPHLVVLERDSLDVFLDGIPVETEADFCDGGSAQTFTTGSSFCELQVRGEGEKHSKIQHLLLVDGLTCDECVEDSRLQFQPRKP